MRAALELLEALPPEQLGTRQLARRVGVSQPALFRHFRTRDQILVAVVEQTRADLEELVAGALGHGRGGLEAIRALASALVDHVRRFPGLPRLVFGDAFPGPGPVRASLQALVASQQGILAELVRQAQREGQVRSAVDAALAARALLGLLQGMVLQWQLADRAPVLRPDADAVVAVWLHGVGAGREGARAAPTIPAEAAASAPPGPGGLRCLDVRPILARGTDPLEAILAELATLPRDGALLLRAPFRPRPLQALLSGRGFGVDVAERRAGLWDATITPPGAPPPLSLVDLEPPEPMERVLAAAALLRAGEALLARLPRRPSLLLPRLAERGLGHEMEASDDGTVLLRVWRAS